MKTCAVMKKGKELNKSIGSKSLSEVARAVRQTASRKATGPDEAPAERPRSGN